MRTSQRIWKKLSAIGSLLIDQPGSDPLGLILDTSVLIAGERRPDPVAVTLRQMGIDYGDAQISISAVSVVELTHGIYRGRSEAGRIKRRVFAEGVLRSFIVHPVTLEIAQLAGRIEGEQAAIGNVIGFEDLLIGATALHLGFAVATLNVRHFQRIPALRLVTL